MPCIHHLHLGTELAVGGVIGSHSPSQWPALGAPAQHHRSHHLHVQHLQLSHVTDGNN